MVIGDIKGHVITLEGLYIEATGLRVLILVAGLAHPLELISISRVITLLRKLIGSHWLVRVEHRSLVVTDEAATVPRLASVLGAEMLGDRVALRLSVGMSFKIEVFLGTQLFQRLLSLGSLLVEVVRLRGRNEGVGGHSIKLRSLPINPRTLHRGI